MPVTNWSTWNIWARGPEDLFTTNPKHTHFRNSWVRTTAFEFERVRLKLSGSGGWGGEYEAHLNSKEWDFDLLGPAYIKYKTPGIRHRSNPRKIDCRKEHEVGDLEASQAFYDGEGGCHPAQWAMFNQSAAHTYTKDVSFKVNGRPLIEHRRLYLDIMDEIMGCPSRPTDELLGRYRDNADLLRASQKPQTRICRPDFSWMRFMGQYLPALQIQSAISIGLRVADLKECYISSDNSVPYLIDEDRPLQNTDLKVEMWLKAYFLTDEERAEIFGHEHYYLIRQPQYFEKTLNYIEDDSGHCKHTVDVPLSGQVQEILYVIQRKEHLNRKDWFNFSGLDNLDPLETVSYGVNKFQRGEEVDAKEKRTLEFLEHHSTIPNRHIYAEVFAQRPEEATLQPTGGVNGNVIPSGQFTFKLQRGLGDAVAKFIIDTITVVRIAPNGEVATAWEGEMIERTIPLAEPFQKCLPPQTQRQKSFFIRVGGPGYKPYQFSAGLHFMIQRSVSSENEAEAILNKMKEKEFKRPIKLQLVPQNGYLVLTRKEKHLLCAEYQSKTMAKYMEMLKHAHVEEMKRLKARAQKAMMDKKEEAVETKEDEKCAPDPAAPHEEKPEEVEFTDESEPFLSSPLERFALVNVIWKINRTVLKEPVVIFRHNFRTLKGATECCEKWNKIAALDPIMSNNITICDLHQWMQPVVNSETTEHFHRESAWLEHMKKEAEKGNLKETIEASCRTFPLPKRAQPLRCPKSDRIPDVPDEFEPQ